MFIDSRKSPLSPVVPRLTSRVLIGSAFLLLWMHVLLVLTLRSDHARTLSSDLIQLFACLIAVAACVVTARATQGFARQFWFLVGGALA